ncbi:MAG: hypothetical protein JWP97_5836 [Labilithrix sp.]|nr:hypothetical protein [Labilithrix sp.]
MMGSPYRGNAGPSRQRSPEPPSPERMDDVSLALLLVVVGGVGMVVGIAADRATELVLGALLLMMGAKVANEARR